MTRCSECGHENMDGLEYCDACGAKLPAVAAAPAEPAPVTEPAAAGEAAPPPPGTGPAEPAPAAPVTAGEQPAAAAAPTVTDVKLTVVRGGTVGKVFPLHAGDNMVGRWDPDSGAFPEVDMENDDPEARISRKHALIRVSDRVTVEDVGSLNGTFVNRGVRLEPGSPVALKDGDEIIVGKTFFRLSMS